MSAPIKVNVLIPTRVIATVFGLAAFTTAVVSGVGAGRRALETLAIALGALVIFHVGGVIVGSVVHRLIKDDLEAYAKRTAPRKAEEEVVDVDVIEDEIDAGAQAPGDGRPAPETAPEESVVGAVGMNEPAVGAAA